jgi:ketosteroid isomerase-like protein
MGTRRAIFFGILVLLMLSVGACAERSAPARIASQWYDAANAGNVDEACAYWAEDSLVEVGMFGTYRGVDEIRAWIEPQVNDQHCHVDYELIKVEGDTATMAVEYTSDVFDFVIVMTDELTVRDGKIRYYTTALSEETVPKVNAWMQQAALAAAAASQPATVAKAWYDAANEGDLDAACACYAEDSLVEVGVFGTYQGVDEIRAWMEPQLTVQNAHVDYELVKVDGDTATMAVEYTSNAFDFVIVMTDEITVRDGKIRHYTTALSEETVPKVTQWFEDLAAQQSAPAASP